MAIKVNGTTVINDSRALTNVASIDATTATAIGAAGVGAPAKGTLGGQFNYVSGGPPPAAYSTGVWNGGHATFSMGSTLFRFGTSRKLLKSTDLGASWSLAKDWTGQGNSNTSGQTDFAHDGSGNAVLIFGDYYSGCLFTTNGGSTWTYRTIGAAGQYAGRIVSGGGGYFWASGYNANKAWRSTNNGSSWTQIGSISSASARANGNTLVTQHRSGDDVTFSRVTNWKTGWSPSVRATFTIGSQERIGRIDNNGTNFVTSCGYYSTDDGASWSRGNNAPTAFNICYVGGRFIVHQGPDYAYSTNGVEWSYAEMGLGAIGKVSEMQRQNYTSSTMQDTYAAVHSQVRGHSETLTRSYVLGYSPWQGIGYSDLT